jgi:hypothetical protein
MYEKGTMKLVDTILRKGEGIKENDPGVEYN